MKNEHRELTVAGWGYRMNERGWVIYRHPHTGRWHTRLEATVIVEAGAILRVHNTQNIRNRERVCEAGGPAAVCASFSGGTPRRGGSRVDHPSSVTSVSAAFPSITTGGPHEF